MSFQKPATPRSRNSLCHLPHHWRTRALVKSGNTLGPGHTSPTNTVPSGFFTSIPCSFASRHTTLPSSFFTPGSMIVTILNPILRNVVRNRRGLGNVLGFHVH